jgi:hypothetical protein
MLRVLLVPSPLSGPTKGHQSEDDSVFGVLGYERHVGVSRVPTLVVLHLIDKLR